MRLLTSSALLLTSVLLSTAARAEDPLPPLPASDPATTPAPSTAPETREAPIAPPPSAPPRAQGRSPVLGRYDGYRPIVVEPLPPPEDDSFLGSRQRFVRFGIGVRHSGVNDAAYAPFSKNDALTQLSLDASITLFARGDISFAAGVAFDTGSTDAVTRGQKFTLRAHRLAIPLEGRYHLFPWLFAFGKVAPGAVILHATEQEPSDTLEGTGAAFSADVSAGASFLLGAQKRAHAHPFRAWITPEFGYGFTGKVPMTLEAEDSRLGTVELASLSTRGFFGRVAVSFGF